MAHTMFSLKKLGKGSLVAAYRHDARTMEVKNADGSKTILNEDLVANEGKSYSELINERLETLSEYQPRKIRSDAVYALSVVVSVPQEVSKTIDLDAWKEKSLEWIRKEFNRNPEKYGDNVISAKLHMDESSPHIHAIVVPIDDKGQLCAYHYIHGPGSISRLHTSYAEAVKDLGLERGRQYSVAKHNDVKKYYTALNEAVKTKAPEIRQGEDIYQYKERADKEFEKMGVKIFAEQQKAEERATARISKEHEITVKTKLELRDVKKELNKLKKEIEDMELELGEGLPVIKEKVKSINAMSNAIENIEDIEERRRVREMMNALIRAGRDNQKKKEKSR